MFCSVSFILEEKKTMELKTPLYDTHVELKGKIVPFAGYLLPVQYETGVIKEHMAVREGCGLFDVSHMGEIAMWGEDSIKNLNHLLCNDYTEMNIGQARYSPMLNEEGGIVDDLIVYKKKENVYLLVVNASNKDKDFAWIQNHIFGDIKVVDASHNFAQLALQGPRAIDIIKKLVDEKDIPEKSYTANMEAKINELPCILSRTGYTGEDGFEIYCDPDKAVILYNLLMETGKEYGLIPCGLGARDTLRLEAGMPLYGHEMSDTITPLEANLKFFVKMNKEDFIGKQALLDKGEITRKRVGLKVTGRGIIREECPIYVGDKQVGVSTSGTHCPYVGAPVAMALLDLEYTQIGTSVEADVRGRRVAAEVVALPFYKRSK